MKHRRLLLGLMLGIAAAFPLACLLTVVMQWPTRRPMYESVQPQTISYGSFDPYKLVVLEGARTWTFISMQRHYQLFVGRADDAENTYGHVLDYSFHPTGGDIAAHIQQSQVVWEVNGVRFVEASGHELFIPKDMFIGGR